MPGINEKREEIHLSDYKGKKLVLSFYSKDNTAGCTAKAYSLHDNYADLHKAGYGVLGININKMVLLNALSFPKEIKVKEHA